MTVVKVFMCVNTRVVSALAMFDYQNTRQIQQSRFISAKIR